MSLTIPAASVPATAPVAGGRSVAARRLGGAAAAFGAAVILAVAAWLEPSPTGLGTHTQAGFPSCPWVVFMDMPCPTCGMTTAFAHAAEGDLVSSFLAQPFGCVLAIATASVLFLGTWVAMTGSSAASMLARLPGRRSFWLGITAILAAWAYKILSFKGVL